jgi:hypothetical protein
MTGGRLTAPGPAARALMERVIRELAAYERPPACEGERRAADRIAAELDAAGCRAARVEEERAHGGYWWPLGLLNAGAALAARLGGRRAAALGGAFAAAAVSDDVGGGRLWFRRRTLPHRPTLTEGMQGFGRRHFAGLPRETTEFVCIECVGSPELRVVEG